MSLDEKLVQYGNDQKHLKEKSYKDASHLDVRILTHQKYTQPQFDFYAWVVDQVQWSGNEVAIDVGCGSGKYCPLVSERAAVGIAGDLSHGMLLDGLAADYASVNLDAMTLPFSDNSADMLLANHMIYHIPDQLKAITDFRRVLKPGGKLIAATNSADNMPEYKELRFKAFEKLHGGLPFTQKSVSSSFSLENGRALLEQVFDQVELHTKESWLIFPEPQPVIDYLTSSRDWYELLFPKDGSWSDFENASRQILDNHFAKHSEFRVTKKAGLFVCS